MSEALVNEYKAVKAKHAEVIEQRNKVRAIRDEANAELLFLNEEAGKQANTLKPLKEAVDQLVRSGVIDEADLA